MTDKLLRSINEGTGSTIMITPDRGVTYCKRKDIKEWVAEEPSENIKADKS